MPHTHLKRKVSLDEGGEDKTAYICPIYKQYLLNRYYSDHPMKNVSRIDIEDSAEEGEAKMMSSNPDEGLDTPIPKKKHTIDNDGIEGIVNRTALHCLVSLRHEL